MERERGAGEVAASVQVPTTADEDVAVHAAVLRAAADMPASWVRAGNRVPLRPWAMKTTGNLGGFYERARPQDWTTDIPGRGDVPVPAGSALLASTRGSEANALHEYVHHLQAAMPELDALFVEFHRRRTTSDGTRDPIVQLKHCSSGARGRPDRYADHYIGREYAPDNPDAWPRGPMEVMTRALELTMRFTPFVGGADLLHTKDPEMLDLVLGALFHFDPEQATLSS